MGQVLDKISAHCTTGVSNILTVGRKRRRSEDADNANDKKDEADETACAKKKKLLTTTQYIYQALFKEEKNSDVAVMVLGKIWNLHKIYLCQSPYFYSMFNGSWRESCEKFVHIQIEDERITADAVDAIFGSLYSDEIDITPKNVISILAAATLFHMDSIIERCGEVMTENINRETVIDYYDSACQYGSLKVKKKAFEWLETNLLQVYSKHRKPLRDISIELMTELVASAELFVMQTEFSLYALLRTWIYLRLHKNFDPDQAQAEVTDSTKDGLPVDVIRDFFVNRKGNCSFLATKEGQQFIKPFQKLRTQYLSTHVTDLKIVLADNIIPQEWIHSHVLSHWSAILKADHLPDDGPQNLEADVFFANCMRCARSLPEPGYQKWRWTGFNFGLDLILILDSRLLRIRRHHRNEHERLLSLQTQRQFMIRASVASINQQRQPVFKQTSNILSLCLEKNEEATIMLLDTKLVHPLLISVNLLVVPPSTQTFKEQFAIQMPQCEEAAPTLPISEIGTISQTRATTPRPLDNATNTTHAATQRVCDVPSSPSTSAAPSTAAVAAISSRPRISSAADFDSTYDFGGES